MKNRKTIKNIISVLLASIILFSVSITAFAASGKWIKSGSRWWYKHTDGTYTKNNWEKINGKWYHFDKKGWMQTGWLKVSGKWYYLTSSGAMKTGWGKIKDKWYYFDKNGKMLTGWFDYKGEKYYFNSNGSMKTGKAVINSKSYRFDEEGKMVTGWFYDGSNTQYYNPDGVMQVGWFDYENNKYYFNSFGNLKKGIAEIKGETYYFDEDGIMHTGWIEIHNENYDGEYYFNEDGCLLKNQFIDGEYVNLKGKKSELTNMNIVLYYWINITQYTNEPYGEWFIAKKDTEYESVALETVDYFNSLEPAVSVNLDSSFAREYWVDYNGEDDSGKLFVKGFSIYANDESRSAGWGIAVYEDICYIVDINTVNGFISRMQPNLIG